MSSSVYKKNPVSVLDFSVDWEDWLAGDTISASVWEVSSTDLTIVSDTFNTTETLIWLSDGIAGDNYVAINTITTVSGRVDRRYITIICEGIGNLSYLIPYVRLRIGDTNSATYRYSDEWIVVALTASVQMLGRYLNYRYLLDSTNSVYRNPNETNWIFDEATYGIIQPGDEQVIVLMATIILLEGSLENSAYNFVSWRDAEISFSNLEQSRARGGIIGRLWDELNSIILSPVKRLAKPIKQSLPGFIENEYEVGNLK